MLDWTHSQKKICSLDKTVTWNLQLQRKIAAFPLPSELSKKYNQNFFVGIHSLIRKAKKVEENHQAE